MIFDISTLFSNSQAITADAASTDIIDLGVMGRVFGAAAVLPRDTARSDYIPIHIQVTEAFNNLTTLRVVVQTSDVENFGSGVKDCIEQVIPLASLVPGRTAAILSLPPGITGRYLRLFYDITGTAPTTGRVTAGLILGGSQTNGQVF